VVSVVLGWRPTQRVNTSYTLASSDSGGNQILSHSVVVDWLLTSALHVHTVASRASFEPDGGNETSFLGRIVYYVNRYIDLQVAYAVTNSDRELKTTSQTLNLFFNGRF
jgi:hypothetical protein